MAITRFERIKKYQLATESKKPPAPGNLFDGKTPYDDLFRTFFGEYVPSILRSE
jgi:hypothetical protein